MGDKKLERTIRMSDIQNNSPYNTYHVYGLPPAPICNPGIASIRAVLNPIKTEYLFFVASGKGDHIFSRNLQALANKNDLLIVISTSGNSKNIINAAKYANKKKIKLVTLSGFSKDNKLKQLGLLNLWCNSSSYNFVEMTHYIWLVSVVDLLKLNYGK
jgi:hypothetical protein